MKTNNITLLPCSNLHTVTLRVVGFWILILMLVLLFLSACSTTMQNSLTESESSVTNEGKDITTGPTQPDLTSTSTEKQTTGATHTTLTRPFPDFTPFYLQFLPQWLLNDLNGGCLAVGGGNIAANYQVWYEFIQKVGKGKDDVLMIQTFEIDSSKEINDSTRYHKLDRYRLSVTDNQAVWKCLSDDKEYITGNFSFSYDAESGMHQVFIGEIQVFKFVYFPYDPAQFALYFGYTPLEDLPSTYSKEDAIRDGCLVIDRGEIQNINVLSDFQDSFELYYDTGIYIRIFFDDAEGTRIMDLGSYNERTCIKVDYSRYLNQDDLEDMYVTTYYDNSVVGVEFGKDVCSLVLGSDFRETIFVIKDVTYIKK